MTMDASQFRAALAADHPPAGASPLLVALWHDGRGDWAGAHTVVQAQDGADAAAVHAYLHRKEGDLANADYWYDRAGRTRPSTPLQAEWQSLVEALLR